MASPGELWSVELDGWYPRLSIQPEGVLVSRHWREGRGADNDDAVTAFGWDGARRWELLNASFVASTRDGGSVVLFDHGELRLVDEAGATTRALEASLGKARKAGDLIVLSEEGGVLNFVDDHLQERARFEAPEEWLGEGSRGTVSGGRFWWVTGESVESVAMDGSARRSWPIPVEDVWQAVQDAEISAVTGMLEVAGWMWLEDVDAASGVVWLRSVIGPHVLIRATLEGDIDLCRCVSAGCCGGFPIRTSTGRLATSDGCAGTVSWLSNDGEVLVQSEPVGDGEGMSSALFPGVAALDDGGVMAWGAPGALGLKADGALEWRLESFGIHGAVDLSRRRIVATGHGDGQRSTVACFELP